MTNNTLTSLKLDRNSIGDAGAILFGKVMALNRSIRDLGLSGNNIGDEGAGALAAALSCNDIVESVNLEGNKISSSVAKEIEGANARKAIKLFDFPRCPTF